MCNKENKNIKGVFVMDITATTIREKIENNSYKPTRTYPTVRKYSDNHIFDEDKSVKWNKEEVVRRNAELAAEMDAYRKEQSAKFREFENDVSEMLVTEYGIPNKAIADKIVSKACEEGHSSGRYEILNYAIDYADFVEDILKLL